MNDFDFDNFSSEGCIGGRLSDTVERHLRGVIDGTADPALWFDDADIAWFLKDNRERGIWGPAFGSLNAKFIDELKTALASSETMLPFFKFDRQDAAALIDEIDQGPKWKHSKLGKLARKISWLITR